MGGAVRRGAGAAPVPGAGALGAAGRARARSLSVLARERGGRVIRKREPRWQSAAERARVAAELIEETESLTDTSTIASPADVVRAGLPPPVTAELPVPIPASASSVGTEPLADHPAHPATPTLAG